MKCSDLAKWIKENPGSGITERLRDHISGCPECRKLLEEQEDLENALRSLPAVEPPAFFETRLKAAVAGGGKRPSRAWGPLLAPAAALLVLAAAVALFEARRVGPARPDSEKKPEVAASVPQQQYEPALAPKAKASGPTAIYPVWPGDGDVVARDDVSIMASLYPAPPPGTVISMRLNDRDLSGRVRAEGELLSVDPGKLESGRQAVTITLREPDGIERKLSFSFYTLEAQS